MFSAITILVAPMFPVIQKTIVRMSMNRELGIVVGKTSDDRTYFVSSSIETLVMYKTEQGHFELGECLEFTRTDFTYPGPKSICNRKILDSRKIQNFVKFEKETRSDTGILLICDILDVENVYIPEYGKDVRVFRTSFLEKVIDNGRKQVTSTFSREQLIGMRIVCKRLVDHTINTEVWVVLNLRQKLSSNNENSDHNLIANIEDKIEVPFQQENRKNFKGFIAAGGVHRDGRDELYIWCPHQKRDVFFGDEWRKNIPREQFVGRWVSFSMTKSFRIDSQSNVQVIDDCMLCRKAGLSCWEVKVPCVFDGERDQHTGVPLLKSEHCGIVADKFNMIDKYKGKSRFEEDLWVANIVFDKTRNIRFILSNRQDRWEEDSGGNGDDRQINKRGDNDQLPIGNMAPYESRSETYAPPIERIDEGRNGIHLRSQRDHRNTSETNVRNSFIETRNGEKFDRPSWEKGTNREGENGTSREWEYNDDNRSTSSQGMRSSNRGNRHLDDQIIRSRGHVSDSRPSSTLPAYEFSENRRAENSYYPRKSEAQPEPQNYERSSRDDYNSPPSILKRSRSRSRVTSHPSIELYTADWWQGEVDKMKEEMLACQERQISPSSELREKYNEALRAISKINIEKKKGVINPKYPCDNNVRKGYDTHLPVSRNDSGDIKKHIEVVGLFRDIMSSAEVCDAMRRFDPQLFEKITEKMFSL